MRWAGFVCLYANCVEEARTTALDKVDRITKVLNEETERNGGIDFYVSRMLFEEYEEKSLWLELV